MLSRSCLAAVGLLLPAEVGHDLGLHLGLVGLTLEQFQDEVGDAGRELGLVTIHVGVAMMDSGELV